MNTRILLVIVGAFWLASLSPLSARAHDYTLYGDVSVVSTAKLDAATRNALRHESLNATFTPGGLLSAGKMLLGAESLHSPELRIALSSRSPRAFGESRPLEQSVRTPTGDVKVGMMDVVVSPDERRLTADVNIVVESPLKHEYPGIVYSNSFSLGSDGGRVVEFVEVPGRPDVIYLLRLAITPTN